MLTGVSLSRGWEIVGSETVRGRFRGQGFVLVPAERTICYTGIEARGTSRLCSRQMGNPGEYLAPHAADREGVVRLDGNANPRRDPGRGPDGPLDQ